VTDIDEEITIHGKGYSNLDQYYKDASGVDRLKSGIKIPFLYLSAINDPFVPLEIIPGEDVTLENENIFIVKTRIGGHLGFYYPGKGCWATNACLSFFESVRINLKTRSNSSKFHKKSSLRAATYLQRSSTTKLTNYFEHVAPDDCPTKNIFRHNSLPIFELPFRMDKTRFFHENRPTGINRNMQYQTKSLRDKKMIPKRAPRREHKSIMRRKSFRISQFSNVHDSYMGGLA